MDASTPLNRDAAAPSAIPASCIPSLAGSKILLTGGTGFFGKWLLLSCLRTWERQTGPARLTILSRDPCGFLRQHPEFAHLTGLDFLSGDVRTFSAPQGSQFDWVIHGATAASAQLERDSPDEMFSVITEGTRHVLDLAHRCSARRVLFISSGAVYGPQPPDLGHIPETYAGTPNTVYGKGKAVAEQMCLEAACGSFECVIARPFAFVGPYLPLDTHFAIGNFIRDCLESRPIVIRGDGTPLRSYLYASELAEWLLALLVRGQHGRAYNIGSEEAISIRDLAALVRTRTGTKNDIVVQGSPMPGAPAARYVPSTERARAELGLRQFIPLPEAIDRTLAWHRAHS